MEHTKNIAPQAESITSISLCTPTRQEGFIFWGNIMKTGTIINGHAIGKKQNCKFILRRCISCNNKKWIYVAEIRRANYSGRCRSCHLTTHQVGKNHPNWKGGRYIDYQGYVRIRKRKHPFSDSHGDVKEHRFIAAEKWGIDAVRGMHVHHINADKTDNRIENLELISPSLHISKHKRTPKTVARMIGEPNPLIYCACGCGQTRRKYDKWNKPRIYIFKHRAKNV